MQNTSTTPTEDLNPLQTELTETSLQDTNSEGSPENAADATETSGSTSFADPDNNASLDMASDSSPQDEPENNYSEHPEAMHHEVVSPEEPEPEADNIQTVTETENQPDAVSAPDSEVVAEEPLVSEEVAETLSEAIPQEEATVSDALKNEDSQEEPEAEASATTGLTEETTPSSHEIEVSDAGQTAPDTLLHIEEHELEEMEKAESTMEADDFSNLSTEDLVKLTEQLNRDGDPVVAGRVIQKIKPLFESRFEQEKAEAMEKFVAEGGDPATFEYKHHALGQRFFQALKGINEKRKINQAFQQKERGKNLEAKLNMLEELRKLVDDHEHAPGYDKFKVIRDEWRKVGPVGPEHAQNLNASFHSLLDRFYSLSEIHHNLRDLDRKKNLDQKLELVSKIEKLAEEPLISKAMKDLMAYQDEFRSLGPVPKDKIEEIKERLKKAVDVIYERRRVFNEERKGQFAEEVQAKEAVLAKMAGFESFVATGIKDWQNKTREILDIQEEWKKVPNRFREKTSDLNKQFWAIFKKFMNAKNDFFRELDKGKKDLLTAKQALVDEVHSLKDGEDFDGIANRMKQLQNEWRQIAPVYGKEGQKIYDDFRAGIDHFFNRLRDQRSGEEKVQTENLTAKAAICEEIEKLAETGKGTRAQIDAWKEQFRNAGFVPMKSIQKINGRFSKALLTLIEKSSEIPAHEKERVKVNLLSSRTTYSSEGVKSLKNQEVYIQKRLQQLRKDVGTLEDNMAMFKMSKNAMALMEDVQKRANLYKLEIKELESQLKEIRNSES